MCYKMFSKEEPMDQKRPRGRPRKPVSEATLTIRKALMFSTEDQLRLKELQKLTHATSEGEVVRNAIRRDYERVTKQRT